ncbi:MAG: hypothetical protein ACRC46_12155 [Thermoguttaceae bacterium]
MRTVRETRGEWRVCVVLAFASWFAAASSLSAEPLAVSPPAAILLSAAATSQDVFYRDARRLEIAEAASAAADWDSATAAVAAIETRRERHYATLRLATTLAQHGLVARTNATLKLAVAEDATQQQEAGRLAATLLKAGAPHSDVAEFLAQFETPFASDAVRYAYCECVPAETLETQLPLFVSDDYRNWARLALAKKYAASDTNDGDTERALKTLREIPNTAQQAWGLVALERLDDAAREADQIADHETRAILQRILGRRLKSIALLEASLASASKVVATSRRDELRLFAARHLALLGETEKARNTLSTTTDATLSVLAARREVENALGESSASTLSAILALAAQNDDSSQFTSEVTRFFRSATTNATATNDPRRDKVALPPDAYEEFYFSPFAIESCGCE